MRVIMMVLAALVAAATQAAALGPAPVDLRTAGNFAILSSAGITNTSGSLVTGDMGVSPIASTAITGFSLIMDGTNTFSTSTQVTGKVYAANYADPTPSYVGTAVSHMETAYDDAAGRLPADFNEFAAGNITSQTLVPGIYKWGTGVLIEAAGVTLQGGPDDVWIFQIAGTLIVDTGAIVTLAGGALPQNVFWQVAGQTTLGTYSQFQGIILDKTAIVVQTGASLNGRALAQTEVTLESNAVAEPDITAPTSQVTAAPLQTNARYFTVSWTSDDGVGSGVDMVHLYYDIGAGYIEYDSGFTGNSAVFACRNISGTYSFYTRAVDKAGNWEAAPAGPDAVVEVSVPHHLGITVQPTSAPLMANIAPAIQVTILDSLGRAVTNATNWVFVQLNANPSGAELYGAKAVAAVAGVATFSNLRPSKVGTGHQLWFWGSGLAGATSDAFDTLETTAPISAVTAAPKQTNDRYFTISWNAHDGAGSGVDMVHLYYSIGAGYIEYDKGFTGNSAVFVCRNVSGTYSFYTRAVDKAGNWEAAPTEPDAVVEVSVPHHLAITVQPTSASLMANIAPSIQVTILDSLGRAVTNVTNSVYVQLDANPSGAELYGAKWVAAVNGVATFSDLRPSTEGTGYQLSFWGSALTGATSDPFDVPASDTTAPGLPPEASGRSNAGS